MPVALHLKREEREVGVVARRYHKTNQMKLGVVNGNQWTAEL